MLWRMGNQCSANRTGEMCSRYQPCSRVLQDLKSVEMVDFIVLSITTNSVHGSRRFIFAGSRSATHGLLLSYIYIRAILIETDYSGKLPIRITYRHNITTLLYS